MMEVSEASESAASTQYTGAVGEEQADAAEEARVPPAPS